MTGGFGPSDVPLAGDLAGLWSDASANDVALLVADLGAFTAGLPGMTHGLRTDWQAALRGAGLGWLFSHLQPVVDAEQVLTGNAAAVHRAAEAYREAADAAREAGSLVGSDVLARLGTWGGPAADQARRHVLGFTPVLAGVAGGCDQVAAVLDASAAMLAAAFGMVNAAATDVVLTLLGEWLAAQAAAPVTAGASETTFAVLAVAQVTLLGAKTLVLIARVQGLLGRVETAWARINQALAEHTVPALE